MKLKKKKHLIHWIVGIIISLILVYMSFLSMSEGYVLTWPVIIGMLALVVIFLYGASELTEMLEAWSGKND